MELKKVLDELFKKRSEKLYEEISKYMDLKNSDDKEKVIKIIEKWLM